MGLRVVIDRRRCIGAGSCIALAPTAFQWRQGDFIKPELLDPDTVDEDVLAEVVAACPTRAIILEEVSEPVSSAHL